MLKFIKQLISRSNFKAFNNVFKKTKFYFRKAAKSTQSLVNTNIKWKTTLSNYISYIEKSYFMYSLPLFSRKVKDQLQYPRKIYFVDNGFITCLSVKFSDNTGRLYENLVFIELRRRTAGDLNKELFYWKSQRGEEVDFVLRDNLKTKQLIQVCYDMEDYDTRKRELRALVKASEELKCDDLLVITNDREGEEEVKSRSGKIKKIKYIPIWKWLFKI